MWKTGYRKIFGCLAATVFVLQFADATQAAPKDRDEGIKAEAPLRDYAGSSACRECHTEKYDNWSRQHMSDFVRYRKDVTHRVASDREDSPVPGDEVFLLVGSRKKMAFVDSDWKVFPYQYHLRKKKWVKRNFWRNLDYREVCGPCHTTALNPDTKQFLELNVGCETCHGPGVKHSAEPEREKMKIPGKTDRKEVLATCRRCHNERQKHARPIRNFDGVFHD